MTRVEYLTDEELVDNLRQIADEVEEFLGSAPAQDIREVSRRLSDRHEDEGSDE